jgi:hypothetical protein
MEIMATPLRAPGSNGSYPRRASASPCHPGQLTGAPSIYVDASGRLSAINVQTPGGLQLDRPRLVTGAPPNIVALCWWSGSDEGPAPLTLVTGWERVMQDPHRARMFGHEVGDYWPARCGQR